MLRVRVVTTASGANAVQVIRYVNRRRILVKHIGSGYSDDELQALLTTAQEWIAEHTHQLSVFPESIGDRVVRLDQCEYLGFIIPSCMKSCMACKNGLATLY